MINAGIDIGTLIQFGIFGAVCWQVKCTIETLRQIALHDFRLGEVEKKVSNL